MTQKIKFCKANECLEWDIEKTDHENIIKFVDLDSNKVDKTFEKDDLNIIKEEKNTVGIAPTFVRDSIIKKPDEKEPSIFKMISDKIKSQHHSPIRAENKMDHKKITKGSK